jgi:L-asparagine transporter-like permease
LLLLLLTVACHINRAGSVLRFWCPPFPVGVVELVVVVLLLLLLLLLVTCQRNCQRDAAVKAA